jgi:hypothetical protein
MIGAGGIKAGKAFVEFVLDDKRMTSGLDSLAGKMRRFGTIGSAVSGPIVAGFAAAAVQFSKTGDEFDKMRGRLGESVEELSSLAFAAERSGSSSETLERGMARLNKNIRDAAVHGLESARRGFDALGLSVEEFQNLSPAERFRRVAEAISGLSSDTEKAAIAEELFGKAGRELVPLLNEGATGIAALQAEAKRLGLTLTNEDAAAAAQLNDALGDLWSQVKAVSLQVGAAIAGPLTEFVKWASEILAWVIAFIRENPNLVRAIAAIATGIAAASAAAVTFGIVLAIISAHPIISALTAISALVLGLAAYFGFASDGAKDFSKQLDKVTAPTGAKPAVEAARRQQAAQVQRELEAALAANRSVPAERASRESASLISEGMDEVVKWTRATAEGVERLITVAQQSGFLAGAS